MIPKNEQLRKIFANKQKRRKLNANLPIEEKFKILLQMQKIAKSVAETRKINPLKTN